MKIAAIDIGLSAIHLTIGKLDEHGEFKTIKYTRESLRFEKDLSYYGYITKHGHSKALKALTRFQELLRKYKVDHVKAIVTHTLGKSLTESNFFNLARETAGIHIEVIDSREKARLTYLGLSTTFCMAHKSIIVLEIGHKKLTLSWISNGQVVLVQDFVHDHFNLLQNPEDTYKQTKRSLNSLSENYRSQVKTLIQQGTQKIDHCIGIGEHLDAFIRFKEKIMGDENPYLIKKHEMTKVVKDLINFKIEGRTAHFDLRPGQASAILPAASTINMILEEISLPEIYISRQGLREGILSDILREEQLEQAYT